MRPLTDHVYFVGIVSKNSPNLLQHAMHIAIFSLNSLAMFLCQSFWNKVSCNINHNICILWYQRIYKPRYFFKETVCISCLSVLIRVFSKSGFYPKILSCAEMQFLEIRSKVKNQHISEAGVSFEIWFGLCIKIWAGEHIFYIWQQTIALMTFFALTKKVGHSGCMFKSVMLPLASIGTWSWGWKAQKVIGKRSCDTRIICLSYSTLTSSSLSHVRFLHTPSLMQYRGQTWFSMH